MRKIKLLLVSTTTYSDATDALTKLLQGNNYDCLHIQSLKALELINNSYQPDAVVLAHHETHIDDFHNLINYYGDLIPIIVLMWMPGLKQKDIIPFVNFGILQIDDLNDPRILRTIASETRHLRDDLIWMEKSS